MSNRISFHMRFVYVFLYLITAFMLEACSFSGTNYSTQTSLLQATKAQWIKQVIPASHDNNFDLFSLRNSVKPVDGVLTIYIEGDGHVWDGEFPSSDPTPRRAIALELAQHQPSGAVVYLARPCQFIGVANDPPCNPSAWTNERYSEKSVEALNGGVDVLKRAAGASTIILVGFSGGGAMAVLVAARRHDVEEIITVAGNLDTLGWTDYHQVRPLTGSLNPADFLAQITSIRQVHYVGDEDEVVPPFLLENAVKRYPVEMNVKIISIKENGHTCCWVNQWPDLWNRAVSH